MVKAGVIIKHDQRLDDGTYEGWFNKDAAAIDWSKPVADVYNTIRAANPAPGAWTTLAGEEVKIYDSARLDGMDQIMAKSWQYPMKVSRYKAMAGGFSSNVSGQPEAARSWPVNG